MLDEPTNFILLYESLIVALQERCITSHLIQSYRPSVPSYLLNVIKYHRQVLKIIYRSTRSSEYRHSLHSLNKSIHQELRSIRRAQ